MCEKHNIGVKDKFFAKVITSAVKRNILNKGKNCIEDHNSNMK